MAQITNSGKNRPQRFRNRLALSTALASLALAGYGRAAHAGSCTLVGGTYECSGAAVDGVDITQALSGAPLNVTTDPGFGIDTTTNGGDAFTLTGTGGLTFTDSNNSAITGAVDGIDAENLGGGALSITATGTVTGNTVNGIEAYNTLGGTDLTVDAVNVIGGSDGIEAVNFGSGATRITTTGQVMATDRVGIDVYNYSTAGDLTVEAHNVEGRLGIQAISYGAGALTVTATGLVEGTIQAGIIAQLGTYDTPGGTDLTVEAVDAMATTNSNGIYAASYGSGSLSIAATGTVSSGDGGAIRAYHSVFGLGDLTIDVVDASGANGGISASNHGAGALSVTATGTVDSGTNSDDGIEAYNSSNGTDLTIDANVVSGGGSGISARNLGTGLLTITADGDVSGGVNGIYAEHDGTGALMITATGTVTGDTNDGIDANTSGGSLTISAAAVTAGIDGINARNTGTGALTVTASGQITAGDDGIDARNGSITSTDLTVSAAGVDAQEDGIDARNYGSGATSVTATGPVTAVTDDGITARSSGTSLTIVATDVSGYESGITARHYGSDRLSITTSGLVEATGAVSVSSGGAEHSTGIYAHNENGADAGGVGLAISAVDVRGEEGIFARNTSYSTGDLNITATGHVQGTVDDGIDARQEGVGALNVSAHDVTGADEGIDVRSFNGGPISVTVDGAVSGGEGDGIRTRTDDFNVGGLGFSAITLNSGAAVSSATGVAITNDGGNSDTTVNTGASVTGAIRLGRGSDNLTFDGGNFSGVTTFDGGDDSSNADGFTDRLAFKNVSGSVAGASIVNWERVTVDMNGTISFNDNTLAAGTLEAVNGGRISMETGAAESFALDGQFQLNTGGTLALEFFTPLEFDTFDITGGASFGPLAQFDFLFDDGFDPFDGLELTFLTAGGIGGFDNIEFDLIGLDPLFTASLELGRREDELFLRFSGPDGPTAVSEPGMLTLFGTGLLGLFGLGRARRRYAA